MNCVNCDESILLNGIEYVCINCGLLSNEKYISDQEPFSLQTQTNYNNNKNSQKMKRYYNWTNEEIQLYNLGIYIKAFCIKINLSENLIENTKSISIIVLNAIKKYDCAKRSKVKDGVILMCIQYISNNNALKLSKQIGLNIKYIKNAEQMIYELVNNNKLDLDKEKFLRVKNE